MRGRDAYVARNTSKLVSVLRKSNGIMGGGTRVRMCECRVARLLAALKGETGTTNCQVESSGIRISVLFTVIVCM